MPLNIPLQFVENPNNRFDKNARPVDGSTATSFAFLKNCLQLMEIFFSSSNFLEALGPYSFFRNAYSYNYLIESEDRWKFKTSKRVDLGTSSQEEDVSNFINLQMI